MKQGEGDGGDGDIVIRAGAVDTHSGAGEYQQCATSASQRQSYAAAVAEHLPNKRDEEGEMHHRRGGVPAEREGPQVEHFHALGKAGVHVVGDPVEAVFAEVAADESQMIARAIEAGFRRHRIKEIQDEIQAKCQ